MDYGIINTNETETDIPAGVEITTYDRLLRAWQNSMEMVRDFEMSSKRIEDGEVKTVFKKFAEDEGLHAAKLREMLINHKGTASH